MPWIHEFSLGRPEGGFMAFEKYKQVVKSSCPVAIKLNQMEIHAPTHDDWGVFTCDVCGERFRLGADRIYGSRRSEQECAARFEEMLASDHKDGRSHENC